MKRVLMGVVAGAMVVGGVVATSVAFAGPSTRAIVTLTCDKNVSATVCSFPCRASNGDCRRCDGRTCNCGPDSAGHRSRRRSTRRLEAATVTVTGFVVTAGGAETTCSTQTVPLPARIDCPVDGRAGARLVVR